MTSTRINLLPAARQMAMRRRRRIQAWAAPVGLCLLALGATWFLSANGSKAESVASQLADTTTKIDAAKKDLTAISESFILKHRQLEANKSVGHHPDWSVLLQRLALAADKDLVLEHCELRPKKPAADKAKPGAPESPGANGYQLLVSGIALNNDVVFRYADNLARLGLFETVPDTSTRPRDSVAADAPGLHLVAFELSASLSDSGVNHKTAGAEPVKGDK